MDRRFPRTSRRKAKSGPFDPKEVVRLVSEYHETRDQEDLGRVVEAAEGLIWSAIRRMGIYTEDEECAQRCRIVLANAVPKYRLLRGSPFGFFWTVISNACRNHLRNTLRRTSREAPLEEAISRSGGEPIDEDTPLEAVRAERALEEGRLVQARLELGYVPREVSRFVNQFIYG